MGPSISPESIRAWTESKRDALKRIRLELAQLFGQRRRFVQNSADRAQAQAFPDAFTNATGCYGCIGDMIVVASDDDAVAIHSMLEKLWMPVFKDRRSQYERRWRKAATAYNLMAPTPQRPPPNIGARHALDIIRLAEPYTRADRHRVAWSLVWWSMGGNVWVWDSYAHLKAYMQAHERDAQRIKHITLKDGGFCTTVNGKGITTTGVIPRQMKLAGEDTISAPGGQAASLEQAVSPQGRFAAQVESAVRAYERCAALWLDANRPEVRAAIAERANEIRELETQLTTVTTSVLELDSKVKDAQTTVAMPVKRGRGGTPKRSGPRVRFEEPRDDSNGQSRASRMRRGS